MKVNFHAYASEMKQMQNAVIENVRSAKVIGSNQLKQASLIKFIVLRFFLFNY